MGNFTMFKCKVHENMIVEVMYERRLKPLEVIFNLKFDVAATNIGRIAPESYFYHHLKHKLGLFNIEHELQGMNWPEGWQFRPYNTRYTYEHTWEAVRQREKTSHLGIDIALTAPERLRDNRQQIKKESFVIAEQLTKMPCFQPSECIELVSRNGKKKNERKSFQNSRKSKSSSPTKELERNIQR